MQLWQSECESHQTEVWQDRDTCEARAYTCRLCYATLQESVLGGRPHRLPGRHPLHTTAQAKETISI